MILSLVLSVLLLIVNGFFVAGSTSCSLRTRSSIGSSWQAIASSSIATS